MFMQIQLKMAFPVVILGFLLLLISRPVRRTTRVHEPCNAAHGNITESDCLTLFERTVSLLQAGEHQPGLSEALVLALRAHITPYDAQFVVLARQLGIRLITSDRELLRKFPGLACSPRGFVEGSGSVHETSAAYTAKKRGRPRPQARK